MRSLIRGRIFDFWNTALLLLVQLVFLMLPRFGLRKLKEDRHAGLSRAAREIIDGAALHHCSALKNHLNGKRKEWKHGQFSIDFDSIGSTLITN
jgi:hypothetical protein